MSSTVMFHPKEMEVKFKENKGCCWVMLSDSDTDISIFIGHEEFKDTVVRAYEKSLEGQERGGERDER